MVKPDGVQRGLVGKILERIEEKGFKIVAMKLAVMPTEKAKAHYAEHVGKKFYQDLVDFITSGPSVSLVVEGRGAISAMRKMNGATNPVDAVPGTIRGDRLQLRERLTKVFGDPARRLAPHRHDEDAAPAV